MKALAFKNGRTQSVMVVEILQPSSVSSKKGNNNVDLLNALPDIIYSGQASQVLATTGETGANDFLDSQIGTVITALAGAAGLLVCLIGVFKAVGAFLNGKMGQGFKVILGTAVLAGILFNLGLVVDLVSWLGDLIGDLIDSGQDIT